MALHTEFGWADGCKIVGIDPGVLETRRARATACCLDAAGQGATLCTMGTGWPSVDVCS